MDTPFGSPWVRASAWVAATALVLWWTLLPFTAEFSPDALAHAFRNVQWVPFVEHGRAPLWSDILGNLALFAPFGLAAWRCLEGRRARVAWLLGWALALSLTVETVQLALPARRTSATDVVTDALGALLGGGIGRLWELRGRRATASWLEALVCGDPPNTFVALWAACLAVWALLPGSAVSGGLWSQTQIFSSSFRRFPGWAAWGRESIHALLLGGLFATLATRSSRASGLQKAAAGVTATFLMGIALESLQLLSPSRRPEIFQGLAFGVGGIVGAAVGLAPDAFATMVAGGALLTGLLALPTGDAPAGETWATLLLGAILVAVGRRLGAPPSGACWKPQEADGEAGTHRPRRPERKSPTPSTTLQQADGES
jgi:glycopeptide antibiotics resistance protein